MTEPRLDDALDDEQRKLVSGLDSPIKIQAFLDETPYSPEDTDRCPVSVLRDRLAHCLDGGLFAAAALRRLGYPPLVVDLLPEPGTDDDHVLAIYKVGGCFGAVAKSNFVGLRFREPVYRSLRELVMSYFDDFFNVNGVKTLRYHTAPLDLRRFDALEWMKQDSGAEAIERHFSTLRRFPLIGAEAAAGLSPVDELSYRAGMLNVNYAGLYKPRQPDPGEI